MEFQKFSSLENSYRQNLIDKVQYEGKDGALWIGMNHSKESFKDALVDTNVSPESFLAASEVVDGLWYKLNSFCKTKR